MTKDKALIVWVLFAGVVSYCLILGSCALSGQSYCAVKGNVSHTCRGQATPGSTSIKTPTSAAQPWEYSLTVDGYIVQEGTSYVNPTFTADHNWLHLEGRYNNENLRTGSLWVGYNFSRGDVSAGDRWEFDVTPMIGGVFGTDQRDCTWLRSIA